MRRALPAAVAAALVLVAAAGAHVTVLPSFLEQGKQTELVFAAPNERPPHTVTAMTLTAPAGVELAPGRPSSGWTLVARGGRATWSGGRTPPHVIGQFRLEATATTALQPGTVSLVAVQRYDDGARVRWTMPLTIVPGRTPPKQHLWPALLAGAVGVVAIAGGLGWLRLRRRPGPP